MLQWSAVTVLGMRRNYVGLFLFSSIKALGKIEVALMNYSATSFTLRKQTERNVVALLDSAEAAE